MKERKRLLRLRQSMKKKRPRFVHQEHWKLKRFRKASWRRPRGKRSKMRSKERAKPALVSIGYRGPKEVRGYHPRGAPEILVHNADDVKKIQEKIEQTMKFGKEKAKEKKKQKGKGKGKEKKEEKGTGIENQKREQEYVLKIGSGVGVKKRIDIVKKAVEAGLYVANPTITFVKIATTEELESLVPIKDYIGTWFVSDKVPEEEREEINERAEEMGIEVEL